MAGVAGRIPHTERYVNPDLVEAHAPPNTTDMLHLCTPTHYDIVYPCDEHCV